MTVKIETYDKPFGSNQGRKLNADTLALVAAIEAARDTGKPQKWVGGAAEYTKNGTRVRNVARAQLGLELNVTSDGEDLIFKIRDPKPVEPAAPETAPEAEAEAETPAPKPTGRKR